MGKVRRFQIPRTGRPRGGALVTITPGSPQSMYAEKPDDEGVLIRYLVPDDGAIVGLRLFIDEVSGDKATLKLSSTFGNDEVILTLDVKQGVVDKYIGEELEVVAGDMLKLSVGSGEARGVWLSFVFRVRADSKYVQRVKGTT